MMCTLSSSAATYYVKTGGNDAAAGTSEVSALATLVKATQLSRSGDTIALRRGDIFRESADLKDRVSLVSFGDAHLARPQVSGAELITGFSPSAENSSVFVAPVNNVIVNLFVNGKIMRIARYPNSGYLWTSANNASSTVAGCSTLTMHQKNTDDYWNGCRMRWRFWSWFYDTRIITDYAANGTMSLAGAPSEGSGKGKTGWGFYLDGKLSELDTAGEWFYDSTAKKVYLWPPEGVSIDNAVVEGMYRSSGIALSNGAASGISFRYFKNSGIEATRTSTIDNCEFDGIGSDSGGAALSVTWDASGINVRNSVFKNCLNCAITWVQNPATTVRSVIEKNAFVNIGSLPGYGGSGPWHAAGIILNVGRNIHVEHNTFDTVGYAAILLGSAGNFAEYNIIRHAMFTLNDGAGIYTNCDSSTIRHNIIMHGSGGWESAEWKISLAHGIWPEFLSHFKGSRIDSNVCAYNNGNGLFFPNNFSTTVKHNVFYGNLGEEQMYMEGGFYTDDNLPLDDTIIGNMLYATSKNGAALGYRPEYSYGVISGNYYCNPFSDNVIAEKIEWNSSKHSLSWWKTNWAQADKAARTDIIKYAGTADAQNFVRGTSKLLVNLSTERHQISVGDDGLYLDLDSNQISGSVDLAPFTAKVLVHTGEKASVEHSHRRGNKTIVQNVTMLHGRISCKVTLSHSATVHFTLIDLSGRTVLRFTENKQKPGTAVVGLNKVCIATGIYFYRISVSVDTEVNEAVYGKMIYQR